MRGVGSKAGDTRGTFRFSNILALTSFCKGFGSNFSDEGHSPTPENTNQSFTPVRLLGFGGRARVASNLPLSLTMVVSRSLAVRGKMIYSLECKYVSQHFIVVDIVSQAGT